jgi:hypothetical protein
MPFCGGMYATTKKMENLAGDKPSLTSSMSVQDVHFHLTLQQPSVKKFQPYTDACDTGIENVIRYKNY